MNNSTIELSRERIRQIRQKKNTFFDDDGNINEIYTGCFIVKQNRGMKVNKDGSISIPAVCYHYEPIVLKKKERLFDENGKISDKYKDNVIEELRYPKRFTERGYHKIKETIGADGVIRQSIYAISYNSPEIREQLYADLYINNRKFVFYTTE